MSLRPGQKLKGCPDDVAPLTVGASGALAIGDVHSVNLALLNGDGEYYTTKEPTAADLKRGWPAVALQTGTQGDVRLFQSSGICYAKVLTSSEAVAVGSPLYFEAGTRTFDVTAPAAAADAKVVAMALEVVASGSATTLIKVMLNGVEGFGTSEA